MNIKKKENGIKAGLKLALYYHFKPASKILKGTYHIQVKDDLAEGKDKLVAVPELNYHTVLVVLLVPCSNRGKKSYDCQVTNNYSRYQEIKGSYSQENE